VGKGIKFVGLDVHGETPSPSCTRCVPSAIRRSGPLTNPLTCFGPAPAWLYWRGT